MPVCSLSQVDQPHASMVLGIPVLVFTTLLHMHGQHTWKGVRLSRKGVAGAARPGACFAEVEACM